MSEDERSTSLAQDATPLAWALAYAAHGLDIFPCTATKHPLTPNGFKDATTDPEIIRAWWARWRFAEPAWALPPGVVVADLDEKRGKHGVADFKRLEGRDPRDVVTPIAMTPNNGLQLFYATAGKAYQNKVGIDASGIDTRTAGGYVVLPAAGNGRKWIRRPIVTPMADAPAWLETAAKREPADNLFHRPITATSSGVGSAGGPIGRMVLARAVRLIMTAPRGAQEDTRHRQSYLVGTLIAAGAVDYDVAYRALVAAANAMPAHGKPWRNLEQKVAASLARGMEQGR
jgi:Bifunctional DNA primase/polymerase, N-terminal